MRVDVPRCRASRRLWRASVGAWTEWVWQLHLRVWPPSAGRWRVGACWRCAASLSSLRGAAGRCVRRPSQRAHALCRSHDSAVTTVPQVVVEFIFIQVLSQQEGLRAEVPGCRPDEVPVSCSGLGHVSCACCARRVAVASLVWGCSAHCVWCLGFGGRARLARARAPALTAFGLVPPIQRACVNLWCAGVPVVLHSLTNEHALGRFPCVGDEARHSRFPDRERAACSPRGCECALCLTQAHSQLHPVASPVPVALPCLCC